MAIYKTYTDTSDITSTDLNTIQEINNNGVGSWNVLNSGGGVYFFNATAGFEGYFHVGDFTNWSESGAVTVQQNPAITMYRMVIPINLSDLSISNTNLVFRYRFVEHIFTLVGKDIPSRNYNLALVTDFESNGFNFPSSVVVGSTISASGFTTTTESTVIVNESQEFTINNSGIYVMYATSTSDTTDGGNKFCEASFVLEYKYDL